MGSGWGALNGGSFMRHKAIGLVSAAALGAVMLLSAGVPASSAGAATILVPGGFDASQSDTRATGHYELSGTGLHIWTEGSTSTDKVAEYVATSKPLADVGEPTLEYATTPTSTATGVPGFQLVVDFDNDGPADAILIGEPGAYGNDWWLNNSAPQSLKDAAPSHTGGFGSANHGTLEQWRAVFPDAQVRWFGFSLGSGVYGDGTLSAINFAGTRYTFGAPVVLTNKDQCKNGGWATSTSPVFKNQGDCVSYFASKK